MRIPLPTLAAGLCIGLCHAPLLGAPVPDSKPAHYPDWWFARDVIPRLPTSASDPAPAWPEDYPVPDDFAMANAGQLKHVASKAALEFEERLAVVGGMGAEIEAVLAGWSASPGASGRDDFAAINQGQLKAVAALFYHRLDDIGYVPPFLSSGIYPWSSSEPGVTPASDDYAAANLGQLKYVFSFGIPGGAGAAADIDGDGLPDSWELSRFGVLGQTGADDPDGDGLSNAEELVAGTDPLARGESTSAFSISVFHPVSR